MPQTKSTKMKIDAYCHVGLPRFGTAEDALFVQNQGQIDRTVLVLGPQVPDYATLFQAMERYGERVRGIGIPFGATTEQVRESIALQIRAGVLGLRIQEPELLTNPAMLAPLGENGRWIYAIAIVDRPEVIRALLTWLDRYPDARIGAPHFLRPADTSGAALSDGLQSLLQHPRFFPILSRQGGVGSRGPHPHPDLRPWVERVAELAGWERILWGSEYPVLYWRNETLAGAQRWLSDLLGADLEEPAQQAFLGDNAQRALFDHPPPLAQPVEIPAWVDAQFDRTRTVPLFPQTELELPMQAYATLHHRYVDALRSDPQLTFAQFVAQQLSSA
jgi:predicted TIM-barrel fold metal-dependent hydrolase